MVPPLSWRLVIHHAILISFFGLASATLVGFYGPKSWTEADVFNLLDINKNHKNIRRVDESASGGGSSHNDINSSRKQPTNKASLRLTALRTATPVLFIPLMVVFVYFNWLSKQYFRYA
jgi:hypothetical protein